jgi:hypothetical protein
MSSDSQNDQNWKAVFGDAQPPPDPFWEPIEERLTKFCEHKAVLLSHLQDAYERSPKAEPFDKSESWSRIERIGTLHFATQRIEKEAMGAAERKKRYHEIANILTRARSMVDDAMRSPDLADGLIDSWWQGTTECAEAGSRFVDLLYIEDEFKKVMKGLAALEEAAARAFSGVQTADGRPRGSTNAYIYLLADLYRGCTGLKPGAGHGPFARFVRAYLTATGRNLEAESVVEIIQDSRAEARRNASQASPFE